MKNDPRPRDFTNSKRSLRRDEAPAAGIRIGSLLTYPRNGLRGIQAYAAFGLRSEKLFRTQRKHDLQFPRFGGVALGRAGFGQEIAIEKKQLGVR